ncbi:1-deoxy-D-xylulose-5-phosphate synthase [Streptomyces puniciscabiei]|uniref:1-deoxy-D-xylulose-5-phosphate synthase n=1 Tax=Streptomyces puniciscabiei TaxID=164348 RepID=UPI0037A462E7
MTTTSQGTVAGGSSPALADLTPAAVREMSRSECAQLAGAIREFLIENVSKTGGHLGANLGVVELTIAIHRAFDSPSEAVVFDIGHQAYTHKILTGRGGAFDRLRQKDGLSGFPLRAESPHDILENSHSAMGPAWALGIAIARGTRTAVVLGDGALTGGVAYEALNAIGVRRLPVVVVYNDNGRSYARTMSRLTLGEPLDAGRRREEGSHNVEQFFGALGYGYVGPVDGHDFDQLDEAFARAADRDGPVVVHVSTQKGYGWAPAEGHELHRLHQVNGSAATPAAPVGPLSPSTKSWSDALGETLCELGARDPRVHVITAAMPDMLGLLDFQKRFPDRFHDVGISEQLGVGLAAGLASQGCRPVFPVFATFLTRGLDQVLNDVALHGLPVTFVLDRAGVSGGDGPSSHGIYDTGLLRSVPGLDIYAPSSPDQLSAVLRDAVARDDGPTAVRYGKWTPLAECGGDAATRSVLRRRGDQLCILTHGAMVAQAVIAADVLYQEHEISASVWEVVRLRPTVADVFADAAQHRAIITVEDLVEGSGLYRDLLDHLWHSSGPSPATRQVAVSDAFLPWGLRDELLADYGLCVRDIVRHAKDLLKPV